MSQKNLLQSDRELPVDEVTRLFRWCTRTQKVAGHTQDDLVQYLWEQLLQSGPKKWFAPFLRRFARCRLVDLQKRVFLRRDTYDKYTRELPAVEQVASCVETHDVAFEISQFRKSGLSRHAHTLLTEIAQTGYLRPRTEKEQFSLRTGREEIRRRFFNELTSEDVANSFSKKKCRSTH